MNLKTIEKLEFNKICDILKNYAITYIGKNYINDLKPLSSKSEIIKAKNKLQKPLFFYTEKALFQFLKSKI